MKNSFAKKFDKVSSWRGGTAVGCVLAALCLGVFVGCGDSTGSGEGGIVPINRKAVSGVAQKGPFVEESEATVRELDGETLEWAGGKFEGTVTNDKGEFSVSDVSLCSQYARLEVFGAYRNEVTGARSSGKIQLNAIVDLSKRKKPHVNVATHLELKRVRRLFSEGATFAAAKKQAEKELFAAFGISGSFASPEELDLFSGGDGSAALLALGLLMQGDGDASDLSRRLRNFEADFEPDGLWDDDTAKAEIADWASAADLARIRANVEEMADGGKVAAFERIVGEFWWNAYGLDSCAKGNDGEVKKNANEISRNADSSYICDGGAWRLATEFEYNVYGWDAEKDGTVRKGNVTDAHYKYDEREGKWIEADALDATLGIGGCTAKRNGERTHSEANDSSYFCILGVWVNVAGWNWDVPKEARLNQAFSYGTMTDSRDGRTYKTTTIGGKTWLAENLRYDYKIDGTSFGGRCYDGDSAKCETTGRLYTWAAAMDSAITGCGDRKLCDLTDGLAQGSGRVQGVCPKGWHLPDTAEWRSLFAAVGGISSAGTALRSQTGWTDGGGTDAFGFSALPAGLVDGSNRSFDIGAYAYFWATTTETVGAYPEWQFAHTMLVRKADTSAYLEPSKKLNHFSVRCVKDY